MSSARSHRETATVIVCTRNRPQDLSRCLASLGDQCPPPSQIVVVDQSVGPEAEETTRVTARSDVAIDHVISSGTGLSLARNEGAMRATGEFLLFTDDDCEVAENWYQEWLRVLTSDSRAGIGFGRTLPSPYNPRQGHIPHFDPGSPERYWGADLLWRGASSVGMGANMALRKEAWAVAGGFDQCLGAGACFPAAEELDLALRLARGGYLIAHSQGPTVIHYGFRDALEASRLAKGYASSTAAMYMKHARCGDLGAVALLFMDILRLIRGIAGGALTNRRPLGANSLLSMLRGVPSSIRYPVDRGRRQYRHSAWKNPYPEH